MKLSRLVIVGAGGLGREVAWIVECLNAVEPRFAFLGFIVSDLSKGGPHDSESILGDYSWLEENRAEVDALALGIGTPGARLHVAAELKSRFPSLAWPTLIHPTASVDHRSLRLEEGVTVCAGVLGTVNVTLRAFSFVNLGATLGHEAAIGRGAILNPSVNISGGVEVGDGVLIGTGAQVLQYLKVGTGATVGAGAVVTKDVPPGVTVVGVPARVRSGG